MGNQPSNQPYPTATSVLADTPIPIAEAYANEEDKSPSAPPMTFDMTVPEPSAPPLELLQLNEQYKNLSNIHSEEEKVNFEDPYERALRHGIDSNYIVLVRNVLRMNICDQQRELEVLKRELKYIIKSKKCNKKRLKIKGLIEERLKTLLRL